MSSAALHSGPVFAGGVEPLALRRASSAFPTGVAVVTTLDPEGRPCGLTVNSFTSVSLAPPLVSWSLNSASPSLDTFDRAVVGGISILGAHQAELAKRFATPVPDKFVDVRHRPGASGAPLIDDCLVHFECRPWERIEAGDHIIYIWQVDNIRLNTLDAPLTFHAGGFKSLFS